MKKLFESWRHFVDEGRKWFPKSKSDGPPQEQPLVTYRSPTPKRPPPKPYRGPQKPPAPDGRLHPGVDAQRKMRSKHGSRSVYEKPPGTTVNVKAGESFIDEIEFIDENDMLN